MPKRRLYITLSIACFVGYTWLILNHFFINHTADTTLCLIKHTTGIPCPACGSTRSMLSLMDFNFTAAMYFNPIGIILAVVLITVPLGLLYDIMFKKDLVLKAYRKMETFFQQKLVAIVGICLIVANWIWNISKGL